MSLLKVHGLERVLDVPRSLLRFSPSIGLGSLLLDHVWVQFSADFGKVVAFDFLDKTRIVQGEARELLAVLVAKSFVNFIQVSTVLSLNID